DPGGMPRCELNWWKGIDYLGNLSVELSSAAAPRRTSKAQRAWRIAQSYRVSAYSFFLTPIAFRLTAGCACFVPEPGQHTSSIVEEKASEPRNSWTFLSVFRSGPPKIGTTLLTSRSYFPSLLPREKPRASSMRQSGHLH